jgi:hypothetical protein
MKSLQYLGGTFAAEQGFEAKKAPFTSHLTRLKRLMLSRPVEKRKLLTVCRRALSPFACFWKHFCNVLVKLMRVWMCLLFPANSDACIS